MNPHSTIDEEDDDRHGPTRCNHGDDGKVRIDLISNSKIELSMCSITVYLMQRAAAESICWTLKNIHSPVLVCVIKIRTHDCHNQAALSQ
jgi:hypothetical protein